MERRKNEQLIFRPPKSPKSLFKILLIIVTIAIIFDITSAQNVINDLIKEMSITDPCIFLIIPKIISYSFFESIKQIIILRTKQAFCNK